VASRVNKSYFMGFENMMKLSIHHEQDVELLWFEAEIHKRISGAISRVVDMRAGCSAVATTFRARRAETAETEKKGMKCGKE
jgi:hypothetical protein